MNTGSDAALDNQTDAGSCITLASHSSASSTADVSPDVSSESASDAQILSCSSAEVHSELFCNDTIVSHEPAQGSSLAAEIGDIFVKAKS